MMTYAELEAFFTGLVATAQARGIVCGITSGMACVHFGVAATTKDCDVLCAAAHAKDFFDLIAETDVRGVQPVYRGNLSPPLDARWMRGGWTSHFTWKLAPGDEVCLDVFGVALRAATPWNDEIEGLYTSRRVVAAMKRTNRAKDWPFITALGIKLLDAGRSDGWLHLFDAGVIRDNVTRRPPAADLVARRPLLQLALDGNERLEAALHAEEMLWHRLDACRIRIYERALRPYVSAVRRATARRALDLRESHLLRVECAEQYLTPEPVREYGAERLADEARAAVEALIHPSLMQWLPDLSGRVILPTP